jgi:hypothetical protein
MSCKTTVVKAGLAGALLLSATGFTAAQSAFDNNPWTHTKMPAANGQCWKMTDSSRGFGYWTNCPQSARATVSPEVQRMRAQAPYSRRYGYR